MTRSYVICLELSPTAELFRMTIEHLPVPGIIQHKGTVSEPQRPFVVCNLLTSFVQLNHRRSSWAGSLPPTPNPRSTSRRDAKRATDAGTLAICSGIAWTSTTSSIHSRTTEQRRCALRNTPRLRRTAHQAGYGPRIRPCHLRMEATDIEGLG